MHLLDELLYQAGMSLAACPTAPGHEGFVRTSLEAQLAPLPHVTLRRDGFGNLFARYEFQTEGKTAFRLVAHMDHPGFHVHAPNDVVFLGGVDPAYFPGQSVTFYHHESPEPLGQATITRREENKISFAQALPARAQFGTWTLPPATCTKGPDALFVSPTCDDLVQVSTMLALFQRLAQKEASAHVEALFTRSEETGFYGALAAINSDQPLAKIPTLSLETSNAQGFAQIGQGPIVRVGDRSSLFDSTITQWLENGFAEWHKQQPAVRYQRLLMGGGTCEATVFHRAGFPTGALCVGLQNYHNSGTENRIESEAIALRDWQELYDFLYFLATEASSPVQVEARLTDKFALLEQKALTFLTANPL